MYHNTTPIPSKEDKKYYAKALSAFSNTSGGIIVWGVDASKNDNGLDAAKEQKPIHQAKTFLTYLNSLLSVSIKPLNVGVKNIYIPLPCDSDFGFVVTYIPENSLPPHRAMLGLNQYFMRTGDSFAIMEHAHLEDMFGKRQRPVLELYYEIESGSFTTSLESGREFMCEIVVEKKCW